MDGKTFLEFMPMLVQLGIGLMKQLKVMDYLTSSQTIEIFSGMFSKFSSRFEYQRCIKADISGKKINIILVSTYYAISNEYDKNI